MKALLIAEKPSLMRDIQAVYNKMNFKDEIKFIALRGHILELRSPDEYDEKWGKPWNLEALPMIPEKFTYKVKKDCIDLFNDVRNEVMNGGYDYLINACDAGREGELIFYSLYKTMGIKKPIKRLWASDTTEKTITNALDNLIDDKDPALTSLKASAQYRAYFDWLMGMNFSRAITVKNKTLIPVGRVMTPTLAIIVKRELELMNFKPKDFYQIEGDFGTHKGIWFDKETSENRFEDKAAAQSLISRLTNSGKIESVTKTKEKSMPSTLHSLTELQKEANAVYGYTLDKTLEIAQNLYEKRKLITYPRTESRCLPKNMVNEIPAHLRCIEGISEISTLVSSVLANKVRMDEVLSSKNYVNDAKVTDHHAIIPTTQMPNLASLSDDEFNIYLLIAKRFLAIFLNPYIVEKTVIITEVNNELFQTSGKVIIDLGYMVLYKNNDVANILPPMNKGDKVTATGYKLLEKQTTPPKRYDDRSLVDAMDNPGKFISDNELKAILKETAGIGTVATRSEIVNSLIKREMIKRKGKSFIATEFGISVINLLSGRDIISPELTAKWESKLAQIEDQTYDPKVFYAEMIDYINNETNKYINSTAAPIGNVNNTPNKVVVGKCPKCGKDVIEGNKFYLCTDYKNPCDFIFGRVFAEAKISKTEMKNILSGKESKEFEFKWKSGKTSKGKLLLDNGEIKLKSNSGNTNGSNNNSTKSTGKSLGKCPTCGNDVVESNGFYVCSNHGNNCSFIMKKIIKSANILESDIEDLLAGKETRYITFVWSNNSTGNAKLRLNKDKLDFIF